MADGEMHDEAPETTSSPSLECDLIMKGGITSGVVYPPAILELAKQYRFRSVGGSSAGAIAAAGAAAAEYGRDTNGFAKLGAMQAQLKEPGFLLGLFQPSAASRPLFDTALRAQQLYAAEHTDQTKLPEPKSRVRQGWQWITRGLDLVREMRSFKRTRAIATIAIAVMLALVGAYLAALAAPFDVHATHKFVLLGLYGIVALGLVALAWRLGGAWGALSEFAGCFASVTDRKTGYYGFCTGMPSGGSSARALTEWLTERLDDLAGIDPNGEPLTIATLKKKTRKDRNGNDVEAGINFRMITTNLSHRQPYTIPMARQDYVFAAKDMEQLFPPRVVQYLVDWGKKRAHGKIELPAGFHRFPLNEDIPVVVATRMSLSFPVLLCAVRLYSIKTRTFQRADAEHKAGRLAADAKLQLTIDDLDEHWFSDGGIASNFPIHMFDAWLPTRPTFGISLRDLTDRHPVDGKEPPLAVLPPPRFSNDQRPNVVPIGGLGGFLGAVFNTAQNYRDNTQAALPSYRERVVHVMLNDKEGGLNLAMPPDIIAKMEAKGVEAARLLREEFDFNQHQWVRILVLMGRLETEFEHIKKAFEAKGGLPFAAEQYRRLLDAQVAASETENSWYRPQGSGWCKEAALRIDDLLALVKAWDERQKAWAARHNSENKFFSKDPLYPDAIMRVTPEH